MPTYEFRCPNGHEFERLLKMSDASQTLTCPECGEPAQRLVSGGAGLLFKGSGFYLTDYGRNAHRGGPAPKKEGGASAGGEGSGGGEKKPAETPKPSSGDKKD